jgi:hypothetical protein
MRESQNSGRIFSGKAFAAENPMPQSFSWQMEHENASERYDNHNPEAGYLVCTDR